MQLPRLIDIIGLAAALLAPWVSYAQTGSPQSKAALTSEINSNFPNNTTGAITPSALRQVTLDMVQSFNQATATTFASLSAVTGTIAFVNDGLAASCGDAACTTWGTTVTGGGGSLQLLVWYNGVHWTLIGK